MGIGIPSAAVTGHRRYICETAPHNRIIIIIIIIIIKKVKIIVTLSIKNTAGALYKSQIKVKIEKQKRPQCSVSTVHRRKLL